MQLGNLHLAYCTNIHPGESWQDTWAALKQHTLGVRDKLRDEGQLEKDSPYAIGLRLSAAAAEELLQGDSLQQFSDWLKQESCYVFTINGFPYGSFHDTRVKENVYRPDWTDQKRLNYTNQLMDIVAHLCPDHCGGSVSTLPGSFKAFEAKEDSIFENLYQQALHTASLAAKYNKDLHLGLEPEPLGHFENTEETLGFFRRFYQWAEQSKLSPEPIRKHIGLNYDTCHFALEFDDCQTSLDAFAAAGIRISKIHLSNALEVDLSDPACLPLIKQFDEPTYLHQVLYREPSGEIKRFPDIPEFFSAQHNNPAKGSARIHFHIPLYQQPNPPLGSTHDHAEQALRYLEQYPECCQHLEMETYTWGVLPDAMQLPIVDQLVEEYLWTLNHA